MFERSEFSEGACFRCVARESLEELRVMLKGILVRGKQTISGMLDVNGLYFESVGRCLPIFYSLGPSPCFLFLRLTDASLVIARVITCIHVIYNEDPEWLSCVGRG
mmetsp:Transcript_47706/g.57488  ORF Transcript_47706/g.57488 Transcript_47706/m.57488 type:complete len:106 (-) Transcript_47706:142-459(-)